jgi:hypothetical protein
LVQPIGSTFDLRRFVETLAVTTAIVGYVGLLVYVEGLVPAPTTLPAAAMPQQRVHPRFSDACGDFGHYCPPDDGTVRLSKGDIVGGMNAIKGRVAGCYDQFKMTGMAMVHVTIGASGKVIRSTVNGSFLGTPTGKCVEHAVRAAIFPQSTEGATIDYPFMLR